MVGWGGWWNLYGALPTLTPNIWGNSAMSAEVGGLLLKAPSIASPIPQFQLVASSGTWVCVAVLFSCARLCCEKQHSPLSSILALSSPQPQVSALQSLPRAIASCSHVSSREQRICKWAAEPSYWVGAGGHWDAQGNQMVSPSRKVGRGLLWTHEECRRRGGCGTPFSVLPNQMCGYHRDGRGCHILHLSFPTAQGSWSFQLSPLFSFFFSFEFVEDCVWKSSGLIRETHSVQAILGEAIKMRQRSFDLEKWSLVLKSFKAIFARKRRGLIWESGFFPTGSQKTRLLGWYFITQASHILWLFLNSLF